MTAPTVPLIVVGTVTHEFAVTGAPAVPHPNRPAEFVLRAYQVRVVVDRDEYRVTVSSRVYQVEPTERIAREAQHHQMFVVSPRPVHPVNAITAAPGWVQGLLLSVQAGAR